MSDSAARLHASSSQRASDLSAAMLLRLAVVLAIVTAGIELALRLGEWYVLRRPVGGGVEQLWLAPVMNLLWMGAAGTLALVIGRSARQRLPASVPLAIAFLPAAVALVWLYPNIHLEAGALLALGIAVQAGRAAAPRMAALDRRLRRAAPVLATITVLAAVGGTGAKALREWSRMAALPDAPRGPNVVLLILDTVRSYSVSGYGYARPTTPRLDTLMRQAVRFDRAFAPASWTLPSHASMFTGRWPHELSARLRNPLDDEYPTLAETMAAAGWATGGFAANHSYLNWEHGLTRGFIRFDDYPVNVRTLFAATVIGRKALDYHTFRRLFGFFDSSKRKTAREVNEEFFEWASGLEDRPFFAMLNYFDAHHPYLPPEPYLTRFGPHGDLRYGGVELRFTNLSSGEVGRKLNQYDGGIAYVDAAVGAVADWLRERGQLDSTVLIITSDHGEHWGDHERLSHGNSMYRQLLQVPLVVRFPSVAPAGTRVRTPVTLRDIAATVLTLSGAPNALGLPGTSLTGVLHPDGEGVDPLSPVLSEGSAFGVPGAQSLVANGLHYIRNGDGVEELFDLEADSLEVHDLIDDPERGPSLAVLRAQLDSITEGQSADRRVAPNG